MNLGVRSGANLFNSRRIGARPSVPAIGQFVDYPETSTILGAAKLTGRTRSGTSLGLLAAVTDRESARVIESAETVTRVVTCCTADVVWRGPRAAGVRTRRLDRQRGHSSGDLTPGSAVARVPAGRSDSAATP
jgi:hypothetical protein